MAPSPKKKPKQKRGSSAVKASPIKGYLPLRVGLPPVDLEGRPADSESDEDDNKDRRRRKLPRFSTYLYVKEHKVRKDKSSQASAADGTTLFVSNAPSTGPIRTDLFLRAIFERHGGEVSRVTVVRGKPGDEEAASFSFFRGPLDLPVTEVGKGYGKFAHVVFASAKDLKVTVKALNEEMMSDPDDGGEVPQAICLDDNILERLASETAARKSGNGEEDDEEDSGDEATKQSDIAKLTGIHAIAAQIRQNSGRHLPRSFLMDKCNAAMAAYEEEEAEAERRRKAASDEPDEDGFVTVSRGTTQQANALEREVYEEGVDGAHRRRGGKRTRKRKVGAITGSSELNNFYRFQMKETKKKEVQDLKKRFEEDLAKVKRMKEEKAYRPF